MTDPTPDPTNPPPADPPPPPADPAPKADTITRWAVYNTTLERFVGGVTTGTKPTKGQVADLLKPLGMADHDTEVRKV